jgi:lipid-binding SYLF domain-containing protein
MFTTTEALDKFRNSKGWTAGVDATVAVANIGANGSVNTASMNQPVVGFVLANAGLEVGASVQGMKVTEIRP